MRNINDPSYYDGDTGQWIPVPLAEMSERDLTRTALGLEDIAAYDLDDPQWREAHRLAERYKRELRARGVAPVRGRIAFDTAAPEA